MILYHKKLIACLLMTALLMACKADFGDQAHSWVVNNARSYSERLSKEDLKARWANFGNQVYGEMEFSLNLIEQIHSQLFVAARNIDRKTLTSEASEDLAETFKQAKVSYDLLLGIKRRFADIHVSLEFLENACSRKTFDALGLARVSSYSVLGSLWGLARQAEWANDQRYGFAIFASFDFDENGNPVSKEEQQQRSIGDFLKSITPLYDSVFALVNEKEIEDQKERLSQAIELFQEKILKPDEVFEISVRECEAMKARYNPQHVRLKKAFDGIAEVQKRLLDGQAARLEWSYLELMPQKIETIRSQLGLADVTDTLKRNLDISAIVQDFDRQLVSIEVMRMRMYLGCRNTAGVHLIEEYEDALRQAGRNLDRARRLDLPQSSKDFDRISVQILNLTEKLEADRAVILGRVCE